MKRSLILTLIFIFSLNKFYSQTFQLDTLQFKGDALKYINIVILGDGYTEVEQQKFTQDAKNLSGYLLKQSPWINYSNYFNVFAIHVISEESGATHANTAPDCGSSVPVTKPNTFLGCSFDSYGIHRLIVPTKISNIVNVLSTNFPNYDQVLILANTPYYGGSGGSFATSTLENSSPEITAHELGHSFAGLADEYYAGDQYARETFNMTKETDTSLVRWRNWLGLDNTGIYQNSGPWYRPHNNCKMRFLNRPYCSVCSQTIVESIHSRVNPIVSYTPTATTISTSERFIDFKLTEIMKPSPNTLKINWELNSVLTAENIDSILIDQDKLSNGSHLLSAIVTDTSNLLRVDNHSKKHLSIVSWMINKNLTGIKLIHDVNQFSYSIYPNPATEVVNFSIELEKRSLVSIDLITPDGITIQQIIKKNPVEGVLSKSINIEFLNRGIYYLVFRINDSSFTEPLIKN